MSDTNEAVGAVVIGAEDFPPGARGIIESKKTGGDHLAGDGDARKAILEAVPAAVAKRLKAICPPDFVIAEVKMALEVKGTPFGVGVGGEVEVVFKPRPGPGGG